MLRRLTLAAVTDELHQKMSRLKHFLVYRTPAFKRGKKFLSLIAVKDPQDPEDPGYFYIRRLGRDSVALVFYDGTRPDTPWLLMEQFHSPIGKFVRGACTGSLDKTLPPIEIAREEALEEVGYRLDASHFYEVGYEPVGANTDERVHLYFVDVTGQKANRPQPENIFEANINLVWCSTKKALETSEWKGQLIILHSLLDPKLSNKVSLITTRESPVNGVI